MSFIADIKEKVFKKLSTKLPDYLTYHSPDHTRYVMEKSLYIAEKEKVSKKDKQLLEIAALYHDVGFIKGAQDHEKTSCQILKRDLKNSKLSDKDLEKICGMIMATKIPQNPKTHLEKIIADADLEYLGTNKFKEIGDLLYLELRHNNKKFTRKDWDKLQINFISNHQYHTKYCKQYKEKYKRKNLELLQSRVK